MTDFAEIFTLDVPVPTVDFAELSCGAQRRVIRHPDGVLARPRGHRWSLMWAHTDGHRAALIAAGYGPVVHIPDLATWQAQPPPQYVTQSGRWGVVAHADGTYTLRRRDTPISLRLTAADLTDVTQALVQIERAYQWETQDAV